MCGRGRQHLEVDRAGLLWPVKPRYRVLPAFFAREQRLRGAALGEDPVWIVVPDHFMHLQQIEVVGLEPLQRLVDLPGSRRAVAAVDLRHQEGLAPVAVASALPMRISLWPSL